MFNDYLVKLLRVVAQDVHTLANMTEQRKPLTPAQQERVALYVAENLANLAGQLTKQVKTVC